MKQQIIKAEILWTRICPLQCGYCSMVDGRRNSCSIEEWKAGFTELKKLGCSLVAIYGAEPLHDFDKLPETIQFAEELGIHTTVITSGVVSHLNEKLKTLYEHGLRSITASYDAVSQDLSSQKKSLKAREVVNTFRSFGPVRDAAIVVTLTRQNYSSLPLIIETMSEKNIWTFFDLIHPDRGQPGSKVKNTDLNLLFMPEDMVSLCNVLQTVKGMKSKGLLCHTSTTFLETVKIAGAFWLQNPSYPHAPYMWNCSDYDCFPSWITVDCNGTVYPCDDFQPKDISIIKVWEIAELWNRFCKIWKPVVKERCPGCLWNTHIDAHLIKRGLLPLTDYIHGIKE
jgi:MoaA/NifB/PqqE/SkfB family radical SAM enzyme